MTTGLVVAGIVVGLIIAIVAVAYAGHWLLEKFMRGGR